MLFIYYIASVFILALYPITKNKHKKQTHMQNWDSGRG